MVVWLHIDTKLNGYKVYHPMFQKCTFHYFKLWNVYYWYLMAINSHKESHGHNRVVYLIIGGDELEIWWQPLWVFLGALILLMIFMYLCSNKCTKVFLALFYLIPIKLKSSCSRICCNFRWIGNNMHKKIFKIHSLLCLEDGCLIAKGLKICNFVVVKTC